MEHSEQELLAVVRDTPASWVSFLELAQALSDTLEARQGLVVHVAGPTDEGVRELELWRSQRDLECWELERERIAAQRRLRPLRPGVARTLVVRYLLDPTRREREA